VIFFELSGAERRDIACGHLLGCGRGRGRGRGRVGDGGGAGSGEDVEAEVAPAFGPLVVLFGEHGADEADQGVAVGKMPTTSVRRRISRLRRSWGLFDQIWLQISRGNL
jgi:hypothetical protein